MTPRSRPREPDHRLGAPRNNEAGQVTRMSKLRVKVCESREGFGIAHAARLVS
jgi:hypothetical protein